MRGPLMFGILSLSMFIFYLRETSTRFFFLAFTAGIAYIYLEHSKKQKTSTFDKSTFLDEIEKNLVGDFEIDGTGVFYVHKNPRSLKFLKRHDELCQILHDLKFMMFYDKACFEKIVAMMEYYLRVHYKVTIGVYELSSYGSILSHIRNEILNLMKTFYLNAPKVSNILGIDDIDSHIENRLRRVQAILYKLNKIAWRKNNTVPEKPPYPEKEKENRYALF